MQIGNLPLKIFLVLESLLPLNNQISLHVMNLALQLPIKSPHLINLLHSRPIRPQTHRKPRVVTHLKQVIPLFIILHEHLRKEILHRLRQRVLITRLNLVFGGQGCLDILGGGGGI